MLWPASPGADSPQTWPTALTLNAHEPNRISVGFEFRRSRCPAIDSLPLVRSFAEIAALLKLWQNRHRASADVKRIALSHVADLDRRMNEMAAMKHETHARSAGRFLPWR